MMAPFPKKAGLSLPDIPALRDVWAKSPVGGAREGESLIAYTAAVLERLAQLYQLRPMLATELEEPDLWHCLYWGTFLHDWGKAAIGFQEQLRPGGSRWGMRHEVLSLAFVDYVAPVGDPSRRWIAAVIVSHHRDADFLEREYAECDPEDDALWYMIREVREPSLTGLWEWLVRSGEAWFEELGLSKAGVRLPDLPPNPETTSVFQNRAFRSTHQLLGEFLNLVDDLRKDCSDGSARRAAILLRGLNITADHAGSAHTRPFPALPALTSEELLSTWSIQWGQRVTWETLHEHQRQCARSSSSIMLSAPTGSGKTESALLWAASHHRLHPPRLFYVLPYQASMNAMQARLSALYGEDQVGLQHGKARHALYRRFLEQEYRPEDAGRAARDAANLARLHHPPVRVLSPYQLLKAAYRLKGYEAVLADAYGGLFIGDEIHAYETKRLALIVGLFWHLASHYRARFCLMSATFPRLLREQLEEALPGVTMVSATPETFAAFRRHRVRIQPGVLAEHLDDIRRAAASGLATLVCCNTVRAAQEVYRALRDKPPGEGWRVELLHGRFNARDRLRKERELMERMGTRVARGDRRVLMVATQVVEVSLDIDFDLLFSEPAPLEALLQRFGRVNRGRRAPLRDVCIFDTPTPGQSIYDERLVARAVELLQREFGEEGAPLDEGLVSAWLDEIYSGEIGDAWREEYARELAEFEIAIMGTLYPFQADKALEDSFYKAFDGIEVLPASLADAYRERADMEPLAADELLVPVRYGQFARLNRDGKVRPNPDGPPIVDLPYTEEEGLLQG